MNSSVRLLSRFGLLGFLFLLTLEGAALAGCPGFVDRLIAALGGSGKPIGTSRLGAAIQSSSYLRDQVRWVSGFWDRPTSMMGGAKQVWGKVGYPDAENKNLQIFHQTGDFSEPATEKFGIFEIRKDLPSKSDLKSLPEWPEMRSTLVRMVRRYGLDSNIHRNNDKVDIRLKNGMWILVEPMSRPGHLGALVGTEAHRGPILRILLSPGDSMTEVEYTGAVEEMVKSL